MKYDFDGGKYSVVFNEETGDLYALRNGEVWQHLHGNKLVLAMLQEVVRLAARNTRNTCNECDQNNGAHLVGCPALRKRRKRT